MIKIKTKLYLFKHIGKKKQIISGYKPAISFEDSYLNVYSGKIELIDAEELESGVMSEVYISFHNEELLAKGLIVVGNTFAMYEPPQLVGEGEILELVLPKH